MSYWSIFGLILFGSIAIWIWWKVPKLQLSHLKPAVEDPKDRAELEDNFRKTIGQVFGAVTVITGLYVGFMQFKEQKQDANALLVNSQIDKGFDQLGGTSGNNIIMHIGGIYVLQDIMNSSPEYHKAIVEALSAFVRVQTENLQSESFQTYVRPEDDVQAALSVLGTRSDGDGYINLQAAVIPWYNLEGLNFRDAYLSGTDLDHAWLEGTNFQSATMTHASLINAKLQGAKLQGANLRAANLQGANLKAANLSGADLRDISALQETQVTQAQLDQACGSVNTHLPNRYHSLAPCPAN